MVDRTLVVAKLAPPCLPRWQRTQKCVPYLPRYVPLLLEPCCSRPRRCLELLGSPASLGRADAFVGDSTTLPCCFLTPGSLLPCHIISRYHLLLTSSLAVCDMGHLIRRFVTGNRRQDEPCTAIIRLVPRIMNGWATPAPRPCQRYDTMESKMEAHRENFRSAYGLAGSSNFTSQPRARSLPLSLSFAPPPLLPR